MGSNLVRCSQQMISSSPSIISTLMQNFSSGHIDLGDKNKGLEVDNTDGLQSFAQLGMYVYLCFVSGFFLKKLWLILLASKTSLSTDLDLLKISHGRFSPYIFFSVINRL